MNFKEPQQKTDFDCLKVVNPMLWAALATAEFMAQWLHGKSVTITSIHRNTNDPYGLHGAWRAVDVRIGHGADELTKDEWLGLAGDLNDIFRYGRTNHGKVTQVFKVRLAELGHHDDPANDHVHIQTPRTGAWS